MKGLVLIIDDNPLDIKVVSTVLERSGYSCHGFTEHTSGLDWLNKITPQVIFLDLQMPQASGFDIIPLIRQKSNLSSVPIIIISGKNQIQDIKQAIQLGANDYIIKPVDPLVLQEKVRKFESLGQNDFFEALWPQEKPATAQILFPIHFLAISEFGLKASSPTPIHPGETIELGELPNDVFGSTKILLRCLSLDRTSNTNIMQFTYVGMSESQRQLIRLFCRQLYVKSKGKNL